MTTPNTMPRNIIIVQHSCGHKREYVHARGATGSFKQEVPIKCPDCLDEIEKLRCAICKTTHPAADSVISGVGLTAVGQECLDRRSEDKSA